MEAFGWAKRDVRCQSNQYNILGNKHGDDITIECYIFPSFRHSSALSPSFTMLLNFLLHCQEDDVERKAHIGRTHLMRQMSQGRRDLGVLRCLATESSARTREEI